MDKYIIIIICAVKTGRKIMVIWLLINRYGFIDNGLSKGFMVTCYHFTLL